MTTTDSTLAIAVIGNEPILFLAAAAAVICVAMLMLVWSHHRVNESVRGLHTQQQHFLAAQNTAADVAKDTTSRDYQRVEDAITLVTDLVTDIHIQVIPEATRDEDATANVIAALRQLQLDRRARALANEPPDTTAIMEAIGEALGLQGEPFTFEGFGTRTSKIWDDKHGTLTLAWQSKNLARTTPAEDASA